MEITRTIPRRFDDDDDDDVCVLTFALVFLVVLLSLLLVPRIVLIANQMNWLFDWLPCSRSIIVIIIGISVSA